MFALAAGIFIALIVIAYALLHLCDLFMRALDSMRRTEEAISKLGDTIAVADGVHPHKSNSVVGAIYRLTEEAVPHE